MVRSSYIQGARLNKAQPVVCVLHVQMPELGDNMKRHVEQRLTVEKCKPINKAFLHRGNLLLGELLLVFSLEILLSDGVREVELLI